MEILSVPVGYLFAFSSIILAFQHIVITRTMYAEMQRVVVVFILNIAVNLGMQIFAAFHIDWTILLCVIFGTSGFIISILPWVVGNLTDDVLYLEDSVDDTAVFLMLILINIVYSLLAISMLPQGIHTLFKAVGFE